MCARLSGQMQELIREARNPMSLAQVCLRAYLSLIFIVIEMQFKNIYIYMDPIQFSVSCYRTCWISGLHMGELKHRSRVLTFLLSQSYVQSG